MAKLTDQQKLFVVQRLACFYLPTEVQAELKQVHGVEVTLPAITYYDPDTAEGARLSDALKQVFRETRERCIREEEAVPIAHRAVRLRRLQDIVNRTKGKNPKVEMAALEQAAKERGGAYTNRRELTGAGGGPIRTQELPPDLSQLTDAELEQWERLLAKTANAGGGAGGEAPPPR